VTSDPESQDCHLTPQHFFYTFFRDELDGCPSKTALGDSFGVRLDVEVSGVALANPTNGVAPNPSHVLPPPFSSALRTRIALPG
jgi:hypothetical protein